MQVVQVEAHIIHVCLHQSFELGLTISINHDMACIRFRFNLLKSKIEVLHVYLNKFENAVAHLFLVILGNN